MEKEIRDRIKELKKEMGVSNIHIAKNTGIHKTTMSLFLNKKKELKEIELKRLKEFLDNYKFILKRINE